MRLTGHPLSPRGSELLGPGLDRNHATRQCAMPGTREHPARHAARATLPRGHIATAGRHATWGSPLRREWFERTAALRNRRGQTVAGVECRGRNPRRGQLQFLAWLCRPSSGKKARPFSEEMNLIGPQHHLGFLSKNGLESVALTARPWWGGQLRVRFHPRTIGSKTQAPRKSSGGAQRLTLARSGNGVARNHAKRFRTCRACAFSST